MIVYHGSTKIIDNPDITYSKKYLDFGRGFYLTAFEEQAKKWAIRKAMRQQKSAIVNIYEISDNWADLMYSHLKKKMNSGLSLSVPAVRVAS